MGLIEKGVRLPDDVSLMALDQNEILQWPPYPINSFEYRPEKLGKETWKVINRLLEGKKLPPKSSLSYHWGDGKTLKEKY